MCIIGISVAGSLSAADLNETAADLDESIDENEISIEEIENNHEDKLSQSEDNEIISANYTPKTSSEIQSCVDNSNNGDTIILNGNYVFESTITVNKSLTFIGINNAVVDGSSNLRLFSINNDGVIFKNITFKNGYSDEGAAIFGKCNAFNCTFFNNKVHGDGIWHYNPYGPSYQYKGFGGAICNVNVINCTFINNSASNKGGAMYGGSALNCTFINNSAKIGGAAYSTVSNNSFFKMNNAKYGGAVAESTLWNCTFDENTAEVEYGVSSGTISTTTILSGGAMYGGSAVNCTFINNYGEYGGAICSGNSINCIFINNSANFGGGRYDGSSLNCIFINNSANFGGGVCNSFDSEIADCSFINNKANKNGNEVYITKKTNHVTIENCNFTNCISNDVNWFLEFNVTYSLIIKNCHFINCSSSGNGGAIYLNNGPTTTLINCYFENNYAINGGAIYYNKCTVSIDNCYFKNNNANYGGAIFYEKEGTVKNCLFENNKASLDGDNLYFKSAEYINIENCNFTNHISNDEEWFIAFNNAKSLTMANCNFVNCSSNMYGGAIYLKNGPKYTFNACYFEGNHAKYGGAFYSNGVNFTVNKCIFVKNTAEDGGAICLEGVLNIVNICDSIFDYNSATGENNGGGAIYSYESKLIIDNCTFTNNSGTHGGVIHLFDAKSKISNSIFNKNRGRHGASIYSKESFLNVDNCDFINNYAFGVIVISGGYSSVTGVAGGIFNENSEINATNSLFKANTGYIQAGAIYGNVNSINCTFERNNAMIPAGAIYQGNAINCTFIGNNADRGGAMYYGTAINCTFDDNRASSNGGATYDVTAINCNFTANNAYNSASNGGAMFGGEAFNCIFINNTSYGEGGALYNVPNLVNSIFVGNIARSNGSAIYYNELDDVKIIGCIFTNSSSNKGSLIYLNNVANLTIKDSVFENCSSSEVNCLQIERNQTNSNILNCIFDVPPENIDCKYDSFLNTSDINVVLGEKIIVTANLSDIRGPLVNKTIHLIMGDVNYTNTTNSEGLVIFDITNQILSFGYYCYNISFKGTESELSSFTTVNINVNKYDALLTVNAKGKYYDDTFLNIKLIDSINNNPISNASLMLEFNNGDSFYLKTDDEGSTNFKVKFTPGTYTAIVHITDEYVKVNNVTTTFTISKINGKITISQTNNTVLDVRLFNPDNGDVYNNITVALKFDNLDPIYVVTNSFGIATYKMDFAPGSYSVLATVSKDYTLIPSVMENIEIKNEENSYSKVTFSSGIVFEYGASGSIYVTVTGGSIDEENIKVLNHPEAKISLVKNVITISNLNPGTYTLFVGSIPSGDLKPGNGTVGITVKKATAVIKASKATVALKKGTLWSIKLVDSKSGKPIIKMKLTLKVYTGKKFKTVFVYTNANGVASYQTKWLTKGTHKVVVSGNHDGYNFNTLTSSISVIKPTKLSFKVKKNIAKDGSSLSITVKKGKKPINGIKIKLLVFTGKKYKTITLKTKTNGKYKGVCGWGTNKLTVGNHKIVIMPVSIKYSGSKTVKMTLKKSAKKYPNWETKI